MSLFGAVWLADILQDRPYLPIRQQKTVMGGGFFLGFGYEKVQGEWGDKSIKGVLSISLQRNGLS